MVRGWHTGQYSHHSDDPITGGEVPRVLPVLFESRPAHLLLVDSQERPFALYPLRAALNEGLVRVVAHSAIPDTCATFPGVEDVVAG